MSGGERRWAARRGRGVGRDGPRTRWRVFRDDADSGKRRRRPALQGVETYLILVRASAPRARRVPRVSTHGRSLDAARPLSWWPRAVERRARPRGETLAVIEPARVTRGPARTLDSIYVRFRFLGRGSVFSDETKGKSPTRARSNLMSRHDPPPPRPLAFVMWVKVSSHDPSPRRNGSSRPP